MTVTADNLSVSHSSNIKTFAVSAGLSLLLNALGWVAGVILLFALVLLIRPNAYLVLLLIIPAIFLGLILQLAINSRLAIIRLRGRRYAAAAGVLVGLICNPVSIFLVGRLIDPQYWTLW
jgi:hypothetical protein